MRSSRNALLTVSIVLLALIYPTMYWILIGGNGWAVLLWDFLAVLPVGMTLSPSQRGGVFTVGVSIVSPSLGVNGFTPLVVTM